ncbi:MAG: DUF1349 domain-containing protein [Flavobacteriaceae bacterium]
MISGGRNFVDIIKTIVSLVGKFCPLLIFVLVISGGCKEQTKVRDIQAESGVYESQSNIFSGITDSDLKNFNWLNKPEEYKIQNKSLIITAAENSDFFINPEDHTSTATAPVLYREVTGDFVAITRVTPDFTSQWNAAALMVLINDSNWIKFGFENSDATGPSIVSVVTRETSDDTNGAILNDREAVWLKIARKGDNYAMHWSIDGEEYYMARLAAMPVTDTVKLGIEAQCPTGKRAIHKFDYFSIESATVQELRAGE